MSERQKGPRSYQRVAQPDKNAGGALPTSIKNLVASKRQRLSLGALVRGVVIAVYEPDDGAAAHSPKSEDFKDKFSAILCDVMIIEDRYRSVLTRVPIMTMAHGITDLFQWTPRAATINAKDGGTIQLGASSTSTPPPTTDTDGDIVVVAFLDNDYAKPVIIGGLTHPQTAVSVSVNDSPKYKYRSIVRGNTIGIQEGGQIDIDATGQTDGTVESGGTESAAGNPAISIKTNGATITIDDDGIKIEESDGTTLTVNDGVQIALQLNKKATISGNTPTGISEALVKAGAWDQLFGPGGAFWTEAFPILTAVGALLGLPTTNLATALGLFAAGVSDTGATTTTDSTESA